MSDVTLSAAATIAAMTGYLKEDSTIHGLTDNINREAEFFGRIKRSSKELRGRYGLIPVKLKGNRNAVGARGELDDLPSPGYQKSAVDGSGNGVAGHINVRFNTARIAFTEPAIQAAMKEHGSFVSTVASEVQDITKDMGDDLNRQHIAGDGIGRLCRIATSPGANVFGVDQPSGQVVAPVGSDPDGALYLEVDDVVAVYSSAGAWRGQDAITDIDRSVTPNEVTLGSTPGSTVVGDYFVKASKAGATGAIDDAYNSEVEGCMAWLSESSTVANIDPTDAGNERWKASVFDHSAAPVALGDKILHNMVSNIRLRAGKAADKDLVHWTTYALRDEYASTMFGDKRYSNTLTLQGGYQVVTFAGRPVMVDKHMLPGSWMALCWSDLNCYNQGGFYWFDRDGLHSRIKDKMGTEMTLLFFSNMGGPRRNVHGLIKGLKEPHRVTPNF